MLSKAITKADINTTAKVMVISAVKMITGEKNFGKMDLHELSQEKDALISIRNTLYQQLTIVHSQLNKTDSRINEVLRKRIQTQR
ncbi:MAG: hypothetical protein RBS77_01725 [Candidatus Moranbacteria bacterium]|jgi:hypothetical protein|nr:hypothetical protein [Candidatus Moranbacteria bacterium]